MNSRIDKIRRYGRILAVLISTISLTFSCAQTQAPKASQQPTAAPEKTAVDTREPVPEPPAYVWVAHVELPEDLVSNPDLPLFIVEIRPELEFTPDANASSESGVYCSDSLEECSGPKRRTGAWTLSVFGNPKGEDALDRAPVCGGTRPADDWRGTHRCGSDMLIRIDETDEGLTATLHGNWSWDLPSGQNEFELQPRDPIDAAHAYFEPNSLNFEIHRDTTPQQIRETAEKLEISTEKASMADVLSIRWGIALSKEQDRSAESYIEERLQHFEYSWMPEPEEASSIVPGLPAETWLARDDGPQGTGAVTVMTIRRGAYAVGFKGRSTTVSHCPSVMAECPTADLQRLAWDIRLYHRASSDTQKLEHKNPMEFRNRRDWRGVHINSKGERVEITRTPEGLSVTGVDGVLETPTTFEPYDSLTAGFEVFEPIDLRGLSTPSFDLDVVRAEVERLAPSPPLSISWVLELRAGLAKGWPEASAMGGTQDAFVHVATGPILRDYRLIPDEPKSAISRGKTQSTSHTDVEVETLEPGEGAAVEAGHSVVITYVAKTMDGTLWDGRNRKLMLRWDEIAPEIQAGLIGMNVGEKRRLYIEDRGTMESDWRPDAPWAYTITLAETVPAGDVLQTPEDQKRTWRKRLLPAPESAD